MCVCVWDRNTEMPSCRVNTLPGQAEASGKYEALLLSIKILCYNLEKAQITHSHEVLSCNKSSLCVMLAQPTQ